MNNQNDFNVTNSPFGNINDMNNETNSVDVTDNSIDNPINDINDPNLLITDEPGLVKGVENQESTNIADIPDELFQPIGNTEVQQKPGTTEQPFETIESINDDLSNEINNSKDLFGGEKSNDTTLSNDEDFLVGNISEEQKEFEKLMGSKEDAEKYIKPKKTFEEQNEFDLKLMKAYIGNKYPLLINQKFSFRALLLGFIYQIYRKFTFSGIVYALLFSFAIGFSIKNLLIVGIVLLLGLVVNLYIAATFNDKYIDKSYSRIKKYEINNNGLPDELILQNIEKIGKLKIFKTIIITIIVVALGLVGGYYLSDMLKIDLSIIKF